MINQRKRDNNEADLIKRAIVTPLIFELCGIIPLLLAGFGVIGIIAGVTLRNVLVHQYYLVFLLIALSFYVAGVYSFLKQKNSCNLRGLKEHQKSIATSFLILSIAEAITLFSIEHIEKMIYGQSLTRFSYFFPIAIFLASSLLIFNLYLRIKEVK